MHATTLMKLALVDSVDHTLKKLPSLLAAVVVDETQFQAVGESRQVSQQLQRAVRLFTEHAEGGLVPPRSWQASQTTRGFAPTCATTKCMRTLSARARGTWGSTTPAAGSARAPRSWRCEQSGFWVKMTFLKRLRQAGAEVARLVKTAAVPL